MADGIFKKIVGAYTGDDLEDDEEEVVVEEETTSEYEEPANKEVNVFDKADMVLVEPRSIEEVTGIVDYLKKGKMCVVNYHKLNGSEAQRLLDFTNGAIYALDGNYQRVSRTVVLYAPKHKNIAGNIEEVDD